MVAKIFGWIVVWMVKAMNFIVFSIEEIPFSKVDNIVITPMQSLIMVMTIVCLLLLFDQRKFYYAILLVIGIAWFSICSWRSDHSHAESRLIVYHISKHAALDVVCGSKALSLCDSTLAADDASIDFHLKPGRMLYGVEDVDDAVESELVKQVAPGKLMVWHGKKILILEENRFPSGHLKVDYLIISKNAIKNLDQLTWIEAGKIIVDSSNSFYLAERLVKQGEASNKAIYSILHQGAYDEII
jgi:competence protein ComEC